MTTPTVIVLADAWGMHQGDVGLGWWIVMMLGMAIFWGVVITLVVWLVRSGTRPRSQPPEEILRQRLADGSISVEEYEQRRAALDDSTSGPPPAARPA